MSNDNHVRFKHGQLTVEQPPAPRSLKAINRAARVVAANSEDATDCAQLLDMLGLDPADGKLTDAEIEAREKVADPPRRQGRPKSITARALFGGAI